MKLHKLRLRNLNSLKGSWEIDFASPALQSEGLFLITGPTGAGKSTILDAICLALYGDTPRLGRISKTSNEIMSCGSAECSAQLSFSMAEGSEVYLAQWSQRRARRKLDGALQEVDRQISQTSDGKVLAQKIQEADELIVELTGLKFDQFQRSILLAQGDFAAFLESSKDERTDILERITGTEIYRQLSERCFERYKQERAELDLLQKEQELRLPLDPQERQALEQQLWQAQQQQQQTGQQLTGLQQLWQSQQSATELWPQNLQLQREAGQFDPEQQQARQQQLQRDSQARELLPLKHKYEEQQTELQNKQTALQASQQKLQQLQGQLSELQQGLETASATLAAEQQFQQLFAEQYKQLQQLEWQNQEAANSASELRQQLDLSQAQTLEAEAALAECQQQTQELQQRIEELKRQLPPRLLAPEWQQQLQQSHLQLQELQQWLQDAGQAEKWQVDYRELQQQRDNLQQQLQGLNQRDFAQETQALQRELEQWRNAQPDELAPPSSSDLPALPDCVQPEAGRSALDAAEKLDDSQLDDAQLEAAAASSQAAQAALAAALHCCQSLARPLDRYLEKRKLYRQAHEESQQQFANLQKQEQELSKVAADLHKQEARLRLQDRYCKTLEEKLELHRRLLIFAEERGKLEEGELCPLCGSHQHAFAETAQPSPDIQATQEELNKQLQLYEELNNAVQGDKEELEKYRLQVESSRETARKQTARAQSWLQELRELRQQLQQILADYQQQGYSAQALQAQLEQELSESKPDAWCLDEEALLAELSQTQELIESCQNQFQQSLEQYREQCAKRQREREQRRQQLEQQLVDLDKLRQEAGYQHKSAQSELANCQKSLHEFCQRLEQEFRRLFGPYSQWLQTQQEQARQEMPEGQESPEAQAVFADGNPAITEELLAILQAQDKADDQDTKALLAQRILQFIADAQLLAQLNGHLDWLAQCLENSQSLQQQQTRLPLLQERTQAAEQQAKQRTEEREGISVRLAEAWKRQQELQQQWQQDLQQLLQQASADATVAAQEKRSLEQWSELFSERLQQAQTQRDRCQTQVTELEKQIEGQQQLARHFQQEIQQCQQSAEQGLQQWQQALEQSGFRDSDEFAQALLPEQQGQDMQREARHWDEGLRQLQQNWRHNGQALHHSMQQLLQQLAGLSLPDDALRSCADKLPELWDSVAGRLQEAADLQDAYAWNRWCIEATTTESSGVAALSQALTELQCQLEALLQSAKEASDQANQNLGGLKKDLQNDDELIAEQQQAAVKLQQKKQDVQYWELLNDLIGQRDGGKFSRFAQQLTFEQLLFAANRYLTKVSDRYLLQAQAEQALEFFVLDLYQPSGQGLRPAKNLSGGEKFLVSLCLALALSQLSAQKIAVQSLFLDEGFGTLDEETLHSALEVLSSLRSDGKLIGLISHVSLLKERIICQIQLETLGEGSSSIRSEGIVQFVSDSTHTQISPQEAAQETKQDSQETAKEVTGEEITEADSQSELQAQQSAKLSQSGELF